MKKKKKVEPIVLNKTELMPTTLGSLETKENGPIFVIILILLFGLCIYFLPNIISFIQGNENKVISVPNLPPPDNSTNDPEIPAEEITYFTISPTLSFKISGFSFADFMIDESTNLLSFTLTNESGNSSYFKTHNYYLELYSGENKLLQRIRLLRDDILTSITIKEDISEAFVNGTIVKLAVREIKEEDYPNVSLKTTSNNEGYLTCQKGTQQLVYYFENENNKYLLSRLEESISFQNTVANYQNILVQYTSLTKTLENINGVETDLLPTTNGFQFNSYINLETINNNTLKKYFSEFYYYKKNTLAKVVAFELETLGYSCS